jgi:hypothetical protein
MKRLICKLFGHKRIHALDGKITCARCRETLKPGAVDQMREMDPEWYALYRDKPPGEGVKAFDARNPGIIKFYSSKSV